MRRRKAFTLVELLVVIGIIALLISILLPTLSRARESAKKTACLSNARELGNSFRLYAAQYKDVMPIGCRLRVPQRPQNDALSARRVYTRVPTCLRSSLVAAFYRANLCIFMFPSGRACLFTWFSVYLVFCSVVVSGVAWYLLLVFTERVH